MALTPEYIVNKEFTINKSQDGSEYGYDLNEVDDFLDEISVEMRDLLAEHEKIQQENEELKQKIEALQNSNETVSATEHASVSASNNHDDEVQKSSAMLQLALELHNKHVHEGEQKRDQLIHDGEQKAHELVSEAQKKRAKELSELNAERIALNTKIADMREFESEYRSTLKSYIQGQLRSLEGSPEPDAPVGLE